MNTIRENMKKVKDAGLQLPGVGYKIMKEKTINEEKQAMLSELTDVVIDSADKILTEAEKLEAKLKDQANMIEHLKKDMAKCKRSYKEAILEKDTFQGQAKKLKTETDTLTEQCKTLRQEKEEIKNELDTSQRSLQTLDFSLDMSNSPLMTSTQDDISASLEESK